MVAVRAPSVAVAMVAVHAPSVVAAMVVADAVDIAIHSTAKDNFER
jgi:hypothetical protein